MHRREKTGRTQKFLLKEKVSAAKYLNERNSQQNTIGQLDYCIKEKYIHTMHTNIVM